MIEKKIMVCASAYVTGNTLDLISEYYNAKEEDIIGSFCDVLDSLDWNLYERVQNKLFKDGYITEKNSIEK